jgi:hypothetical protein
VIVWVHYEVGIFSFFDKKKVGLTLRRDRERFDVCVGLWSGVTVHRKGITDPILQ